MECALIDPVRAELSRTQVERLMSACIEQAWRRHPPRYFPVALAEAATFEYMSDLELMLSTAPRLRDIAQALDLVSASLDPVLNFSLAEFGAQARLVVRHPHTSGDVDAGAPFVEQLFLSSARFVGMWLQVPNLSGRLTLRHQRHAGSEEFEAAFPLTVSIDYGQDLDAVWFDRSLLDRTLRGGMPSLHHAAMERVSQDVRAQAAGRQSVPASGLAAAVEERLRMQPALLAGGLKAVAAELGMHQRALQRRLTEEGASYFSIRDSVRFALAKRDLLNPGLTVEHIAKALGFAERTGFAQAFQRWSGMTPSQFRLERSCDAPDQRGKS